MKTLVTAFLLCMIVQTQAQMSGLGNSDSTSIDVVAKGLADIAMKNESRDNVDEANIKAAEYNYKAQKTAWLDLMRFTINLNEFTVQKTLGADPSTLPGRAFWPRYNFQVHVPFGTFTNLPKQTKVQYYHYQAEIESAKMNKQNLGLQTMTLYYDFVRTQRLYELQEEAVQDASFAFTKTEEKFSKGEVPLDVYTATNRRYNTERATKVSLEHDLLVGKAQLESLLGMPLEAALRQVRATQKGGSQRR